MALCCAMASAKGYRYDVFVWHKPDLSGRSHQGGPRQACSCEYVVAVYKHEHATSTTLEWHYALLAEREKLRKVRK